MIDQPIEVILHDNLLTIYSKRSILVKYFDRGRRTTIKRHTEDAIQFYLYGLKETVYNG